VDVGGNEKYVSLCRKHFMEKVSFEYHPNTQ
jgi:thymidine kinase